MQMHAAAVAQDAPLNTPRGYTPDIATTADWIAFANRLGISRGIVVQPSVYGLDNQVLVEALAAFPDRLGRPKWDGQRRMRAREAL